MKGKMDLTSRHFEELREVLGKKYLTTSIESHYDFIQIATNGLNANVIKNFGKYFNLSLDTTAHMLNVSAPSIYRWTKANKNLLSNLSVKLFEISDLFLKGIDVFGSKESFFTWLNLPNTAFGGMQPQELIDIPEGVSKIKEEQGIYS